MAKKLSPGRFRPAAILAAKLGAEAIGTASLRQTTLSQLYFYHTLRPIVCQWPGIPVSAEEAHTFHLNFSSFSSKSKHFALDFWNSLWYSIAL